LLRYRVAHRSAAARPGLTQVLGAKGNFNETSKISAARFALFDRRSLQTKLFN
jgi:hypothetical protein